jgi:hypothetical protein
MINKKYFFTTIIGLALISGCGTRDNMQPTRGTTAYEAAPATDNSGTTTETQKKARGASETGTTDGTGSNSRSSSD